MRVHFVNENVGGHVTLHLHLAAALAEYGDIDAHFFDVPPAGSLRKLLVGPVPGLSRLDLDLHPLRDQLARSFLTRRYLASFDVPPDVLHLYTHNTALLSVGLMARQPTVVSLDLTNEQNGYRLPQRYPTRFTPLSLAPTKALERRVYGEATALIAQSQWAASSLVDDYGVAADRIHVIPLGIGIPPLRSAPSSDGAARVTFVGRSMERKGGWWLLDVWRRYVRDVSVLTLVTPEHIQTEDGVELVDDIHPSDGRIFDILASTSIYAFPSPIDPFGYSIIEAMAMAVPVVAFDQAAVPEIVEDGTTGILVTPGDTRGFAEALRTLIGDPELRRRMGEAGRARALERFDARVTTRRLVEVLRGVGAVRKVS